MGGVATMKAMNKVVGIGLVNSPVSAAVRVLRRPSLPISKAADHHVKPAAVVVEPIDVQKTVSGFDDWDFADADVEDVVVSPRMVLGGVPSLAEAKEATSQLKQALEKVCLSSPVSPRFGSGLSSPVSPRFGLSSPVSPRFGLSSPVSPRFGVSSLEDAAVPTHAMQAFKYLKESQELQDVVAAVASDPNIWKAVYENQQVQHFIQSNLKAAAAADADDDKYNLEDEILYILKSTKVAVVDMIANLCAFFSNLFGGVPSTGKDSAEISFFEKALGPSLMGLVIMVMMLVSLKRTS